MSEAIGLGSDPRLRPPEYSKPKAHGLASPTSSPVVGALGLLLLVGLLIIGIGMIVDSFPATIVGLVFVFPSFLYLSYRVFKD